MIMDINGEVTLRVGFNNLSLPTRKLLRIFKVSLIGKEMI
jgi:hypothetical protein